MRDCRLNWRTGNLGVNQSDHTCLGSFGHRGPHVCECGEKIEELVIEELVPDVFAQLSQYAVATNRNVVLALTPDGKWSVKQQYSFYERAHVYERGPYDLAVASPYDALKALCDEERQRLAAEKIEDDKRATFRENVLKELPS